MLAGDMRRVWPTPVSGNPSPTFDGPAHALSASALRFGVMADAQPTRLLGFLASTTLRGHLEVAATQSLTWLLGNSREVERRLLGLLQQIDVPVPDDLDWVAEAQLEDLSRPDVEGRLPGTKDPVVRIEAKFSAALTDEQLVSYSPTPVVVLHPAYRQREVEDVIGTAGQRVEGARFASMTWDDLFDALTADLPDGVDRENVGQLKSLADVATGLDVRPFGSKDSVESIAVRGEDLSALVVRASAIRGPAGGRLLPTTRDRCFDVFRYFPTKQSWWGALGLRKNWVALEPATPFWLRFHSSTSGFAELRAGWDSSGESLGGRIEGGHLFFPLELPRDIAGAGIERSLRDQTADLMRTLGDAAPGAPAPDNSTASEPSRDDEDREELYRSLVDAASRVVNPFGRVWPLGADADFERRVPSPRVRAYPVLPLRAVRSAGTRRPAHRFPGSQARAITGSAT